MLLDRQRRAVENQNAIAGKILDGAAVLGHDALPLVRIEAPSLAWLLPALRLAGRLAGPVPGLLSPTQIFLLRRTR